MPMSSSSFIGDDVTVKTGWLHKYSVGRGMIPVKNWQRRWFTVNHIGLNYAKSADAQPQQRTFIPFVAKGAVEVMMNPVFLLPTVSSALHPEACDLEAFYFGLRFEESKVARVLLLRAESAEERGSWVRFLSRFLHVGSSSSGVPVSHPLDTSIPRGHDPEQLDARERVTLRSTILNWDEGEYLRQLGECPEPIVDMWESDNDGSTSPGVDTRSRRPSTHNTTPSAPHSGHSSPRPPTVVAPALLQSDYDCL